MNSKMLIGLACAVLLVAGLLALAWSAQRTLERGLPPRDDSSRSQAAAKKAAEDWALLNNGGAIHPVRGTGSMAPFIKKTTPDDIVAYAVTQGGATWYEVTPGALCLYRYGSGNVVAIHCAAKLTSDGWIMSGLSNSRHDIRMNEANFVGIVARVFIWKS